MRFDEIVAFAEIEKFEIEKLIDTAAKRHSSGMHVRLAFNDETGSGVVDH